MGTGCSLGGTGSNWRADTTEEPRHVFWPGSCEGRGISLPKGAGRRRMVAWPYPQLTAFSCGFYYFQPGIWGRGLYFLATGWLTVSGEVGFLTNLIILNGAGLNWDNLVLSLHVPVWRSRLQQKHRSAFHTSHNLRFSGPKSELDRLFKPIE